MSALSEEAEQQVKTWHAHALSARAEAMQALHQCYLTQSYCSRLEEMLLKQRLKMRQQRARLKKGVGHPLLARRQEEA
jgi:hypothetical protein